MSSIYIHIIYTWSIQTVGKEVLCLVQGSAKKLSMLRLGVSKFSIFRGLWGMGSTWDVNTGHDLS